MVSHAKNNPGQFSGLSPSLRGGDINLDLKREKFCISFSHPQTVEREREMTTFILLNFLTSRGKLTSSKCNQKNPKTIFKMSPKVTQNHLQNVTKSMPKPTSQCQQMYSKAIFTMSPKVCQNRLQNVTKSMQKPSSQCHQMQPKCK